MYTTKHIIPPQVDNTTAQTVSTYGNAASSTLTAFVVGNFLFQFFLYQALSVIWGALNNLQLIVHLILLQIIQPGNVQQLMIILLDVTSLNIFPYEKYLQQQLDLNQRDNSNQTYLLGNGYQLLGYNDCFFLSVFSFILYQLGIIMVLMLFWLIIRIRKQPQKADMTFGRIKQEQPGLIKMLHIKLDNMLRKSLFFSSFIRIAIQSFFQLAVMTFLVFAHYMYWDSSLTIINSSVYLWLGLTLILITFFTGFFLRRHSNDFNNQEFKSKYGSLFDNQKSEAHYTIVLFFTRRLLYAISIQWMGTTSQLALHVFTSLAMLMYLFWVQPMETPLLNFTEIYNELTFLFCIYFTFLFTDYTDDASQKETYGWGFIALVLLNITVNLLIVVYLMLKWLCNTISLMFKRYVDRIVMNKYQISNKAQITPVGSPLKVSSFNDESSRKSELGETSFLVTHRSPKPSQAQLPTNSSPPPAKQTNDILKHFEMKYSKDSLFNHQWQQAHKRNGGVSFSQKHGIQVTPHDQYKTNSNIKVVPIDEGNNEDDFSSPKQKLAQIFY